MIREVIWTITQFSKTIYEERTAWYDERNEADEFLGL